VHCMPAYDAVLVNAAAVCTPQHLADLIRPTGALVMPVGPAAGPLRLKRLYKCSDGCVTMCMFDEVEAGRLATCRHTTVAGVAGFSGREP
jgi:protein-L-isoaspartate O-methyltransferase